MKDKLINKIFNINSPEAFEQTALEVFRYQYENVSVYRKFCDLMRVTVDAVSTSKEIPFLPIQFFKSQKIIANGISHQTVFASSGTTGQITSKHYVADLNLYEQAFYKIFNRFYGSPSDYVILALLPSYMEREGSSLIYMVEKLIEKSENEMSGFYLHDLESLAMHLNTLEQKNTKVILIGVSYALLDLIELQKFNLQNTIIMETGGMKGRRREMVKAELHETLKQGFGVRQIHSEYGMTELLSQAYSSGDGKFSCPPWMKIYTRDSEDAKTLIRGKTGGINVIDLANLFSCAFIATQDLGVVNEDGTFEIRGRFDASDIRGCNLMIL